nr:putative ribonuclease H-like domain-containing protein [Tanacetum cinerariifolium]
MRIKQYFLITNYSLWEVILNGDSHIPTRVVDGVVQPVAPTTAKERLAKKNELKAQRILLMALPDKHQLKFNIYEDAKSLMEAIKKRFGGNKETKKVHKTLLKQQYENFTGSSFESLDQIHDRLQKLISQLEILEDINLKFLRSLPTEWRTHTLIWRNKTDLEDQSLDDLFNSLKIYEAEVKSLSTTSPTTQNIAFVSSQNTDNTNESVSVVTSVSATSTKVPISALPNVDTLSDAMSMLTMRAKRFLQRTGRNLGANGTTSIGFDMSKVECYNCHRRGHFARECMSPKVTRRNVPVETQRRNVPAEEEPTNYALMAFTSSSSSSSDNEVASCFKACTKAYATLQSHYDKLTNDLKKSQFDVLSYKTGLESVEARIIVYQQNETIFKEDIKLLKLDVKLKDAVLVDISSVFDCDEMFSSESDVSMPASPVYDRFKSGEGYHAVTPPYTRTFMPPKPDLIFHDAPNVNETVPTAFNVEPSSTKPSVKIVEHPIPADHLRKDIPKSKGHSNSRNQKACFVCRSLTYLIKDLVLTRSKLVPLTAARPVTTIVPYNNVTRLRPAKTDVTKPYSPPRRTINHRPSPSASTFPPKVNTVKAPKVNTVKGVQGNWEKRVIDSGCSRHMTGNMSYLSDFKEINGRYVAFGGNPKGGKITGKLDFDDVYFIKELKFNLFSVLQMCDKKNNVLFKDTKCVVLSSDFKLSAENYVLLRFPRENNMYNVYLKNIVPSGDLTCLFAKATLDKSNLWHRRLGQINFKTMNKLVKGNLVRGLPSKVFENTHTCVACKKGKQHRAFCKSKPVTSVSQPLQRLHMDLFRPTFVKSLNKKSYCLVVTDDYSRFGWVFFLATKDETSTILKTFITSIENQINLKVKIIRSDNGTEFKKQDLNQFCKMKGIKREFSVAITPQQNGKFDGKADEGFLVGYFVSSKAFRVFNSRTKIVQETLHINFLENQPNVAGSGPTWLFDIDTLIQSMNYQPVVVRNQPNSSAGIQEHFDADKAKEGNVQQYVLFPLWSTSSKDPQNTDANATFKVKEPESKVHVSLSSSDKTKKHDHKTRREAKVKSHVKLLTGVRNWSEEFEDFSSNSTNGVNATSIPVIAVGPNSTNNTNTFSVVSPSNNVVSLNFELGGKSSYVDPS